MKIAVQGYNPAQFVQFGEPDQAGIGQRGGELGELRHGPLMILVVPAMQGHPGTGIEDQEHVSNPSERSQMFRVGRQVGGASGKAADQVAGLIQRGNEGGGRFSLTQIGIQRPPHQFRLAQVLLRAGMSAWPGGMSNHAMPMPVIPKA